MNQHGGGQTELVFAPLHALQAVDGRTYTIHVYGQPRADGTWAGWLAFVPADDSAVRRTGRETTQPTRAALVYWASGLEPVYWEGAFARTQS